VPALTDWFPRLGPQQRVDALARSQAELRRLLHNRERLKASADTLNNQLVHAKDRVARRVMDPSAGKRVVPRMASLWASVEGILQHINSFEIDVNRVSATLGSGTTVRDQINKHLNDEYPRIRLKIETTLGYDEDLIDSAARKLMLKLLKSLLESRKQCLQLYKQAHVE